MKAIQENPLNTISELTLSYRPEINPSQRPLVKTSDDAYQILMGFWNLDQINLCESFCVMLLNNRKRVLGVVQLSTGGMTGVVADTRMIFSVALKACTCSIIVAHNHPGGDTAPSSADIQVTRRLSEAGKILEVKLDDHLIITTENYFSFAEQGYL